MSNEVSSKVIASLGIVGCGWLGSALAYQLKAQGVAVLATRSNIENTKQLKSQLMQIVGHLFLID